MSLIGELLRYHRAKLKFIRLKGRKKLKRILVLPVSLKLFGCSLDEAVKLTGVEPYNYLLVSPTVYNASIETSKHLASPEQLQKKIIEAFANPPYKNLMEKLKQPETKTGE